jgi:hypothetical protein
VSYTPGVSIGQPAPWDFQPGIDTADSWPIFAWYLQLAPPRRLKPVALQFQLSVPTVSRWAAHGLWQERARAWDQHLTRMRHAAQEEIYGQEGKDVAKAYLDTIRAQKAVLDDQVDKLMQECIESPTRRLRPNEIVRLSVETLRAERLLRGQATEIVGEELDLSQLTDEELAAYEALTSKARRKESAA